MKLKMSRTACVVLAACAVAGALSACAPIVIGGAAVGTLMAADRRTAGSQVEDEGIEMRASSRIREQLGDRVHINVTSYNRQVLLTGEAATSADAQKAEQIVLAVENVRSVVNDVGVMPNSSLSQRSNDTFITGKVRASFVDAKDLYAAAFKVVTERDVVYLMGRVTQREATRAAEIARGVNGVRKVVRVFETITDDDVRRGFAQQPASSQPAPVTQDPAAQPRN